MSAEPEFQRLQRQFAAHLRDPGRHPPPAGIEDRRLNVYRTLFFNNIESFISRGFPVLRTLYDDAGWRRLVRAFFDGHACRTPYFVRVPGEFVEFVTDHYAPGADDPPFLAELAHYEWMELALETDATPCPETGVEADGDLMAAPPYPSPWHRVLTYQWPVHRIGTDFQPSQPAAGPVWLLIYRDRAGRVAFMEINAVTARLLALITERPELPGEQLIRTLAREMAYPDVAGLLGFASELLAGLRHRGVLLGTRC